MFEQHPVPQQISSYQFRLVGDMTLKQFFQLAAGAVLGLIVYSLPLPGFLKWPLIALFVIGGAAFAFLPIQDRPLEQWLVAFFRSIYAPTIFVWKQKEAKIEYFATTVAPEIAPQVAAIEGQEVPTSLTHDTAASVMDTNEKDFLSRVSSMFRGHPATPISASSSSASLGQAPTPPAPPSLVETVEPTIPTIVKQEMVVTPTPVPAPITTPTEPVKSTPVSETLSGTLQVATQQAQFSPDAAPPTPPTQPNIVVGQVMDANKKIVEGAILEITDEEGRPVRALKTNRAGHFLIVTPLPNGKYRIVIEKEGLNFKPITLTTSGETMAPIAIAASNNL